MNRIQVLPDHIAHKIAAGEVIERPASVVKELVENSIDALATSIEVEIRDGGKELIRVSDNGVGIHHDDLETAFLPHATSKISTVEDLFSIVSLGFRGEALASIASISDLILRSRTKASDRGYQISFNYNHQAQIEPVGMDQGTIVEVRRLFYNTPARYKFLKQSITEKRHVIEFVANIALAHPQISFKLVADDRLALRTYGQGQLKEAIAALIDHRTVKDLIAIDQETSWGRIRGYLSKPNLTRKNRRDQLIIINGRVIESPVITSAIERAYAGLLGQREFPVFFIMLKINPQYIDVNVHPAKSEVRFSEEIEIFQDISSACKSLLLAKDLTMELKKPEPKEKQQSSPAQESLGLKQYFPWQPKTWSKVDEFMIQERKTPTVETAPPKIESNILPQTESFQTETKPADRLEVNQDFSELNVHEIKDQLLNGRIIGQFRQTYILLETDNGLWLLDQHIVDERILYEKFVRADQNLYVQQIIPQTFSFNSRDSNLILEHLEKLQSIGVELEEFGANTFLLRGIPQYFSTRNEIVDEELILNLINDLADQSNWQEKTAITMACKGAIKAGQRLNNNQIHALLKELTETENPFTCPHGRPIIVRMEDKEISRRFGR